MQVVAERFLGFSTRDAVLAQSMWASTNAWGESANSSLLERQLRTCTKAGDASSLISHLRKQLLRDLCFGLNCDTEWEGLPEDLRKYLINRCLGHSAAPNEGQ